jgi:ribonuclease BN (tRNA processing enzyme)
MPELRLVPLGVGDAFSALHYSTCLALVAGDRRWLLVDCPHPIRKILREASLTSGVDLPLSKLVGVALTHLHADHASGLEGLGAYSKYVLRNPPPDLFMGSGVLNAFRERSEADLFRAVAVTDPITVGPFTIEMRAVRHGDLPACALRVACGGRRIGHSGDTSFDPDLICWLAEADLVVHEVGSQDDESAFHTAYSRLASLPDELRRKLRIAHYVDDFDLDHSTVEPLRQGLVYAV